MGTRDPWWPLDWDSTVTRPKAVFEAPDGRVFKVTHHIGEQRYHVSEHPSVFRAADREHSVGTVMELRAHLIWAITGPGKPKDPSEEAKADAPS